ncbi:MAG: hypothetical protein H6704_14110 [Myxococcales bacterium]|nr:hypothetical protein [Myxococcales bacterium]
MALRPVVAPSLESDGALVGLWPRLGVRRLTPDDVADDLVADAEASTTALDARGQAASSGADVDAAGRSLATKVYASGSAIGAGAEGRGRPLEPDADTPASPDGAARPPLDAVLTWLDAQPPARAARVAAAPRFPDALGRRRPLVGPDALRLTPAGALGELVRSSVGGPPRPSADVEVRWGAVLARLGARPITLVEVVEAAGEAAPAWWDALHAVLAAAHGELSGRDAARVALAPIFLCRDGTRRPARGAERGRVPSDEALVSLCPEVPWLDARQGAAAHVRGLGEALGFGARDLVAVLAAGPDDALAEARLDWLAAHPDDLGAAERSALAAAPVWSDADGAPRAARRAAGAARRAGAVRRARGVAAVADSERVDGAAGGGAGRAAGRGRRRGVGERARDGALGGGRRCDAGAPRGDGRRAAEGGRDAGAQPPGAADGRSAVAGHGR